MANYQIQLAGSIINKVLVNSSYRFTYVCDPDETDQGAAGNGNSLKDLVDTIGTSKNAIIWLDHHPADGNTTTYSLGTSLNLSSYPSLFIASSPGAILDIGSGRTLTMYSPNNLIAGPYKIKSGLGTLAFNSGGVLNARWWGALGDNDNDDTDELNEAIAAIPNYSTLKIPYGIYKITDKLSILSSGSANREGWAIIGESGGLEGPIIRQYTSDKAILEIGGSGSYHHFRWKISNLQLDYNTQQTTSETSSYAIGFALNNNKSTCRGEISDIFIYKAYRGIGINAASGQVPVWGNVFRNIQIQDTSGSAFYLISPTAIGMPTNILENVYVAYIAEDQAETTFQFGSNNALRMNNIEVNLIKKRVMTLQTSRDTLLTNFHFEHVDMTDDYDCLIYNSGSNLTAINGDIHYSSLSGLNVAHAGYIFINLNNDSTGAYGKLRVSDVYENIDIVSGTLYFAKASGTGDLSMSFDNITMMTASALLPSGDSTSLNATYNYNGPKYPTIPEYANNAAAISGGLGVGDVYRNGDVLQVVH